MSDIAPIPHPSEWPALGPDMFHVGWRCTAEGHDCLVGPGETRPGIGYNAETGRWFVCLTVDHGGEWTPLYAKLPPSNGKAA